MLWFAEEKVEAMSGVEEQAAVAQGAAEDSIKVICRFVALSISVILATIPLSYPGSDLSMTQRRERGPNS